MALTGACVLEPASPGDEAEASEDPQLESSMQALAPAIRGINLPPKNPIGNVNTNHGAFSTGPLLNDYRAADVARIVAQRNGLRLAINPETVESPYHWGKTRELVAAALRGGASVILCMFDSNRHDAHGDGHGDGRPDSLLEAQRMWATVAGVYRGNLRVYFEAFNEPFGYDRRDPARYVREMASITAALPRGRVILDGLGYADDVQSVARYWRDGLLGYHVYPNWIGPPRTQSNYSNFVQHSLRDADVRRRTFVTEFGARVTLPYDYDDSRVPAEDVQYLKGMDDAFGVVKPRGTFLWHGLDNGDSYSFWSATASARSKIIATQAY